MDIRDELELQDCPFCGGPGLLEEENGWCWYVMCMDCGAQSGTSARSCAATSASKKDRRRAGAFHAPAPCAFGAEMVQYP